MKTIDWHARRAATPASCTCPHCERDSIVVDRVTGLRFDHYTEPKQSSSRKNKRQREKCVGGGQLYTSTPAGTT